MKAVSSQSAGSLDVPISSAESVKAELLYNFRDTHHTHILFVGKDKKDGILELVFSKHLLKFLTGDLNSFFIRRVDDVDEGLCVLVVMLPELSDFILSSDVPNGEFDLLELNSFDIESDGGNWGDNLTKFEFIEDGGLTSSIETQHEGAKLFLTEERVEKFSKTKSHLNYISTPFMNEFKRKSD